MSHAPSSPAPATPRPLDGLQRKHLRGLAHGLEPVVRIGGAGLTAAVLGEVDAALSCHELVKVRLLDPEDKRSAAQELSLRTSSSLCGLVGHTVILYREHPDGPKIRLPRRD